MKIIFMGTPEFAVPCLDAIVERHEVLAVCTQPDRPGGRGHKLRPSPVKEAALAHGIPVLQPHTLRKCPRRTASTENTPKCDCIVSNPESCPAKIRQQLADFCADIFVVAAYGLLLPKGVLEMPVHGCVNVHASLLPKYRGASPIHSAILHGETETGITIMQMDTGLDTGDIILQKSLPIAPDDAFPGLHNRMANLGANALMDALAQIENGTATRTPQDNSKSSHAPLIKKTDGEINWKNSSEKILNQIRAFDPWPGCYTMYNGEVIKIFGGKLSLAPYPTPQTLIFETGDGAIEVTEVQAAGKKRMPAEDFLRGVK